MKKNIILILSLCLGIFSQSCSDYLDVDRYLTDRQSLERIFDSRDYTEQWLANAYYQLLSFNLEIGHTRFTLSNYSDDMIYTEGGSGITYSNFKFGKYGPQYTGNAGDLISKPWAQSYQGIRQASIFIENVRPGEEITEDMYKDLKGQAYFVRGYFYWLLLRKYGPVPILPEQGLNYESSYDELSLPRNTYDECAEYIAEQMLEAAKLLEMDRSTRYAARPTKGAALAVRAKAYLYAASPLANGNEEMAEFVDDKGNPVISQQYDETKWAKAAAACLDVIKLGKYKIYTVPKRHTGDAVYGAYPKTPEPPYNEVYSNKVFPEGWMDIDPLDSYRALFNGDLYVAENPELIFSRGDNQLNDEYGITSMSRHQMPVNQGGGWNCHGITGKQCDAYAMNDGKAFDRKTSMKGFTTADGQYPYLRKDVWLEYANREPRFYASVAFSGCNWSCTSAKDAANRDFQAYYYYGESEGRKIISSNDRWIPTGVGMMKYVNPKESYKDGTEYPKVDPAIRYADILLMYAEALNELTTSYQIKSWSGEETYTVSRDVNEMKSAVLPIRLRGGVPNYDEIGMGDPYNNADELRKQLKHERQIEFLGENQRYYDLRRWKDAPVEEAQMIYGCNSTVPKDSRDFFYEQVVVSSIQTAWSKKSYFWPISYNELKKNKRLTQAPGWPSFD
ncbi:MAG: RagB/SusD family nutrient uptake outer membrane protein [Bacteroidales bacterium]|nr:RagB/SusD family nutrient uptake outer membrane protein [Bacteroidales bacterium]